jgi:hypothetical protein
MRSTPGVAGWAVVLLLVAACGGPTLPLEHLEAALVAADCAALARCGGAVSEAACVEEGGAGPLPGSVQVEALSRAISEERLSYDGARGQRCAELLRDRPCEDVNAVRREGCFVGSLFEGRVEEGGACRAGECAPGFTCRLEGNACGGTCVAPAPDERSWPGEGESCEVSEWGSFVNVCNSMDLSCNPDSGRCERVGIAAPGGACSTLALCRTGELCMEGVCRPLGRLGEACVADRFRAAALPPCQSGLVCLAVNAEGDGTCARPLEAGAACSAGSDCRGELVCSQLPGQTAAVCQPGSAPGSPCDGYSDCAQGAFCELERSTCRAWSSLPACPSSQCGVGTGGIGGGGAEVTPTCRCVSCDG